jgi:hypothetical protein
MDEAIGDFASGSIDLLSCGWKRAVHMLERGRARVIPGRRNSFRML